MLGLDMQKISKSPSFMLLGNYMLIMDLFDDIQIIWNKVHCVRAQGSSTAYVSLRRTEAPGSILADLALDTVSWSANAPTRRPVCKIYLLSNMFFKMFGIRLLKVLCVI